MRRLISVVIAIFCVINLSFGHPKHHHDHASCTASIGDMDFGSYNPLDDNHVYRTETLLTIRCVIYDDPVSYSVKLIGGNSPNPYLRYMYSSTKNSKIYYYLVAEHKCRWGDGTNGTCVITDTVSGVKHSIVEKSYIITGVILPNQDVPVAYDYRDSLQVIIEY